MLESYEIDLNKKEKAEKEHEEKLQSCYERMDEEFGDIADKLNEEAERLALIYDIESGEILEDFIREKFWVKRSEK